MKMKLSLFLILVLLMNMVMSLSFSPVCRADSLNAITNGSFESDLTGWSWSVSGGAQAVSTVRTDGAYDGSKYIRITNNSPLASNVYGILRQQTVSVKPDTLYHITLWARTQNANGCCFGGGPDWSRTMPFKMDSEGVWIKYTLDITTGSSTTWDFIIMSKDITTQLDVDCVTFIEAPVWHGSNIWYPELSSPYIQAPARAERYFRKTFNLETVPQKVLLAESINWSGKVYINGSVVNVPVGFFTPKTYDVTRYLTAGTNVIAVQARTYAPDDYQLGTGYWDKPIDETISWFSASVQIDLDIKNADGTLTDLLHSDDTWKTSNQTAGGWTASGFNDSAWPNAQVLGSGGRYPSADEQDYEGLEFHGFSAEMYFMKGSAKNLNVRFSSLKYLGTISNASIQYVVRDADKISVQTGTLSNVTFTNGISDQSVSLTPDIVGFYTVEFTGYINGTGVSTRNLITGDNRLNFCINETSVDTTLSNFGICSWADTTKSVWANKLGMGWIRSDISWQNIQPVEGGPMYWDRVDGFINSAVANNVKPLAILNGSAVWASTAPAGTPDAAKVTYKPDLAKWQTFITAVVNRYKDSVKYWEVWNEANWMAWSSSVYDYIDLLQVTYNTIKSIDPDAKVMLSSTSGAAAGWIDTVYKNGGKGYFDIIGIHPYRTSYGPEIYLTSDVNSIKAAASANGDAGREIWITEIGNPTGGTDAPYALISTEELAKYLVRYYVMSTANGIAKTIWYTDCGGSAANWEFFEAQFGIANTYDVSPKEAVQSCAIMNKYLNGASYVSKIDLGNSDFYDYKFTKNGLSRYVLWTTGNQANTVVNFGVASITRVDMYGRTQTLTSENGIYTLALSQSPIYIILDQVENTNGIAEYLKFDEYSGTTAYDSSSNNNSGTISGAAWTSPGKVNGCLSFDGINDYVTVPSSSTLNLTQYTISMWVKLNALPGQNNYCSLVVKGNDCQENYELSVTDDGKLHFPMYFTDGTRSVDVSTSAIQVGVWTHVALTYDETNAKLYINGALDTTRTYSKTPAINNGSLMIGNESGVSRYINGKLDELCIFSQALSAGEIQEQYTGLSGYWKLDENSGTTVYDSSINNNSGTVNGAAWTSPGKVNGCLSFDGVNDFVSVENKPTLNLTQYTVAMWVKLNALPSPGSYRSLVVKGNDCQENYELSVTEDGKLHFPMYFTDGTRSIDVSTSTIQVGLWTHVALTYDGMTAKLYINGALDTTRTYSKTPAINNGPLIIGNEIGISRYINGMLDELYLYNRVLSSQEIQNLYNN